MDCSSNYFNLTLDKPAGEIDTLLCRYGGAEVNNKQADAIITNYKPHKGFFDLSIKPKDLSKVEYAKILNTQNLLARENKRTDVDWQINNHSWEQLKTIATKLQQIIIHHWGNSIFEQ